MGGGRGRNSAPIRADILGIAVEFVVCQVNFLTSGRMKPLEPVALPALLVSETAREIPLAVCYYFMRSSFMACDKASCVFDSAPTH